MMLLNSDNLVKYQLRNHPLVSFSTWILFVSLVQSMNGARFLKITLYYYIISLRFYIIIIASI